MYVFTLSDVAFAMCLVTLAAPPHTFSVPYLHRGPNDLTDPLLPHPTDAVKVPS